MDHQTFVDCVDYPCCVISVRKTAEGGCGEIRIVVANAPYKQVMGPAYYDNMVYCCILTLDLLETGTSCNTSFRREIRI